MIPIAKPYLGEEEAQAAREAILSGWVTQGPRVKEFEDRFAEYVGAKYASAVSSCTAALHLALLAVGVRPGDVVITVSHSFIATANAIRYCGAEPVFVDIEDKTFNIDTDLLVSCIEDDCDREGEHYYYQYIDRISVGESPLCNYKGKNRKGRVAAVLAVHQMGMPCRIDKVVSIAKKYNLPVVEDAACAIGSEFSEDGGQTWDKIGKPHGDIACFSFHPRKVLTTGDGGMLTTNNPHYDEKFRLLRQHGMSVPDTIRHSAKKVVIEEYLATGFNYRMTDIQAAVGIEQLKKLNKIISERRNLAKKYTKLLEPIKSVSSSEEPDYAKTNWQSYSVRLRKNLSQKHVMQTLLENEVATRPGIMNAHESEPYRETRWRLSKSESCRNSSILLPFFCGMSANDLHIVTGLLKTID